MGGGEGGDVWRIHQVFLSYLCASLIPDIMVSVMNECSIDRKKG